MKTHFKKASFQKLPEYSQKGGLKKEKKKEKKGLFKTKSEIQREFEERLFAAFGFQRAPSLQSLEGTPIHRNRLLRPPSPSARGAAGWHPGLRGGGGVVVTGLLWLWGCIYIRVLTGIRDVLLEWTSRSSIPIYFPSQSCLWMCELDCFRMKQSHKMNSRRACTPVAK